MFYILFFLLRQRSRCILYQLKQKMYCELGHLLLSTNILVISVVCMRLLILAGFIQSELRLYLKVYGPFIMLALLFFLVYNVSRKCIFLAYQLDQTNAYYCSPVVKLSPVLVSNNNHVASAVSLIISVEGFMPFKLLVFLLFIIQIVDA